MTLDDLRKLEAKATPGPWVSTHHEVEDAFAMMICNMRITRGKYEPEEANRNFIAALRNAAPALIACAEQLKKMDVAYMRLLENGRDRILLLGGKCDPLDVMERNDVDLREAREALRRLEQLT